MFKSKRVRELEEVAMQRLDIIEFLESKLRIKDAKIEHIQKLIKAAPEGCSYGPWCRVCEHARTFMVPSDKYSYDYVVVCRKSEVCKNFVAKEKEKEE